MAAAWKGRSKTMNVDLALVLAIGLCIAGAYGVAASAYWLHRIKKNRTPSRLTDPTRKVALTYQHERVLAVLAVIWCICLGVVGLVLLFEPALRAAITALLSSNSR